MKEIVLIKVGEMVLKGLNRKNFESMLIKNMKNALRGADRCKITSSQSTIRVEPLDEDADIDEICERISKVFGIVAFHRAAVAEKNMDSITEVALKYLEETLGGASTFKVLRTTAEISSDAIAAIIPGIEFFKIAIASVEVPLLLAI